MERNETAIVLGLALILYLWWRASQFGQPGFVPSAAPQFATASVQYGTQGLTPYGYGGRC